MENDKTVQGANQSANMYSYQEDQDQKYQFAQTGAIRRSLGEGNPSAFPENQINNISSMNNERAVGQNSIIIHIDQTPPLYWMFFVIFGIFQVIFIILLGCYYSKDNLINLELDDENGEDINKNGARDEITKNYKIFQEINVMIFLGFGFLRSFLKHHSWTSIAITLMGGIVAFEFGLFTLICWGAIFKRDWNNGIFNFQHFLDANYCAATIVISLGAVLGKLSLPQYLVMIFLETIFSTLNYVLLRQTMKIIDVGGALTVHLFGSIFGGMFSLVSSIMKNERERIRNSPHLGSNYNSNIFALFGTLLLITYFPSFNVSLIKDYSDKFKGVINTYLAILGSIVGSFCFSPFFNKGKIRIKDILNSCFSGGIIVAGSCHIINQLWASIILGVGSAEITTFLCNILSDKLKVYGYHDTSDIIYYHGIPGFLGGIVTTIFVGNLLQDKNETERNNFTDKNVYDYIGTIMNYTFEYNNNTFNSTDLSKYAGIHFSAIFITLAIAIASGFFAGFLIKFCNCNFAIRYFNDSEYFDVTNNESFPWDDELIDVQSNSRIGNGEKN